MNLSMARSRSKGRRGAPQRSPAASSVVVVHGWSLFGHPCFLDQVDKLLTAVENERAKKPDTFEQSADFKLLRQLGYLAFDLIPQDPTSKQFRQDDSLGEGRTFWFRGVFGNKRFRLFFRFRTDARVVIYAWVNDDDTLRTYGSQTDAYYVFSKMLDGGNPPDDWDTLLQQSSTKETLERTDEISERVGRLTNTVRRTRPPEQ